MIFAETRYCGGAPEPEAALCIGPLRFPLFLPLELGSSIGQAAQEVDARDKRRAIVIVNDERTCVTAAASLALTSSSSCKDRHNRSSICEMWLATRAKCIFNKNMHFLSAHKLITRLLTFSSAFARARAESR
jgi:hypothetical protein